MNIVHLTPSLSIGGTESFVVDIAIKQRNMGYNVKVVALDRAKDINKPEEIENNNIDKLKMSKVDFCFASDKGRYDFFGLYFMLKKLHSNENNLIHVHFYYFLFYVLFSTGSAKVVFTQHTRCLRYPYFHKLMFNRVVDRYVAISKDCYESIISTVGYSKTVLINNGVSTVPHCFVNNSLFPNDFINMIYVGRLDENKNVYTLIDVVKDILSHGVENFKINIVGGGPIYERLKLGIEKNNLTKYIYLLGPRTDVPDLLKNSDVFIFPSKVEGFSIALIEALFSNLVIVSSNASGNKDILSDGDYGYIFDKNKPENLKLILLDLLKYGHDDKRDLISLSEHSTFLSMERCAGNYIDNYKGLFDEA